MQLRGEEESGEKADSHEEEEGDARGNTGRAQLSLDILVVRLLFRLAAPPSFCLVHTLSRASTLCYTHLCLSRRIELISFRQLTSEDAAVAFLHLNSRR